MKIVVLEPLGISEEDIRKIASPIIKDGNELVVYKDRIEDTDILKERVMGADVLIIANMPLKGEVIKSAENLKMISVAFTGVDHVDINACLEKNIVVCNAAGYSTSSVAELTYGLMLSVFRNIVPLDKITREGKTKCGYGQTEILGKTLGIIGTGAIGIKVAEIAQVFGCKVIAYSRSKKSEIGDMGIKYVSLDKLLKESDIVSVHVPLTDETKYLINKEKIGLMKRSAVIINTARGSIIDNKALAKALKEGRIAGAGIDVFDNEPPLEREYDLLNVPSVVVTPHIGFATKEAMVRRAHIVIENIAKWKEGNPQNLISK
ncbi:NAD(P)-dependent oxidoreductase [Clostridium rectalis]|uniref:NAD(P)-dependent oxidoreductase n=1 Tax=Clostridium rectalis TaxID=2040295 RepID=UPI000F641735|nr:NAD(P)-dependent oxidoreductase [Clostridium rectalis]